MLLMQSLQEEWVPKMSKKELAKATEFDEAFKQSTTLLSAAFGHAFEPVVLRVWHSFLVERLTPQELIEAVKLTIVTRPLKSGLPTAQDLVDTIKGDGETLIYDQWALIRKALRQPPGHLDYQNIVDRFDVITSRILEVMGGLGTLRDLDGNALDWARKDFCKMYLQYLPRRRQLEEEAIALRQERERVAQKQARLDEEARNAWRKLPALPSGVEVEVRPIESISALFAKQREKINVEN